MNDKPVLFNDIPIPPLRLHAFRDAISRWTSETGEILKQDEHWIREQIFAYGNIGRLSTDGTLEPYRNFYSAQSVRSRMGINVFNKEYSPKFNIVTPSLKDIYDKVLSNLMLNDPTFAVRSKISSTKHQLISRGTNALLQHLMEVGGFYEYHKRDLFSYDALMGTGYTRVNFDLIDVDPEDPTSLGFDLSFDFIPITRVIDDGTSISGNLEDSSFVIVLHGFTRGDAKLFFKGLISKRSEGYLDRVPSDIGGLSDLDLDIDGVLTTYEDRKLDRIYVAEVFWKDFETNKRYTTYMLFNTEVEPTPIYQIENDDDFQLPIKKLVYNFVYGSRFGYTPVFNFVELANAENQVYNTIANLAHEASYKKVIISDVLTSTEDEGGEIGYKPYKDQTFRMKKMNSGEGVANYFAEVPARQVDTQLLVFLDRIRTTFQAWTNVDTLVPPTRSSTAAYNTYVSKTEAVTVTYLDNLRIYYNELAQYLMHLVGKYFTPEMLERINKNLADFVSGVNLLDDIEDIKTMSRQGFSIELSSRAEAITEGRREDLMQLLQIFGPDLLRNRELIDFMGLMDMAVFPTDDDVYNCEKEIDDIVDGRVTDLDALFDTNGVYGTGVANRLVYIPIIEKRLKQIKNRFESIPVTRQKMLNEYLVRHFQLYLEELKRQQMMQNTQSQPTSDEQLQQSTSEEVPASQPPPQGPAPDQVAIDIQGQLGNMT